MNMIKLNPTYFFETKNDLLKQKVSANAENTSYYVDGREVKGDPDILWQDECYIADINKIYRFGREWGGGESTQDNIKYYETMTELENDTTRVYPAICYVKEYDKVYFLKDKNNIPTYHNWNFSTDKFINLGTVTENAIVDDLTLNATSTQTIVIQTSKTAVTIDDESFTHRLSLSRTANADGCTLSFNLKYGDDVSIYLYGAQNRILRMWNKTYGGEVLHDFYTTASYSKLTYHHLGEDTTVVLGSTNSGIDLYAIKINA